MSQLSECALKYAELGWHVFPLAPGKKTPITSHGVKDATVDEAQIRAWWERWPTANIGVACGKQSGIYVIDVDVPASGDANGLESLKEFPQLPITVKQHTPRGGFHAFYKTDDAPANRNSFRPGIDLRGDGYYVVLAPSIHPNGGVYAWDAGHAPWEVKTAAYPDYMRPVKRTPWEAQPLSVVQPASRPHDDDTIRRASLWLAECDPAVQGQAGHDKLFWAAQGMVNGCRLSDEQAYSTLASEYNQRCCPPWDLSVQSEEKDFRRKISEARRNPPRDKPVGWIVDDPDYAMPDASNVKVDVAALLRERAANANLEMLKIQEEFVESAQSEEPFSGGNNLGYWITDEKDEKHVDDNEFQFLVQPTGLLGEICSWINSTSIRSQPFLTLACSLTFLGVLYGRKIKDATGNRTNLYAMGVARSSAGKAHAPHQIRRLCEAAGCMDLLGGDDVASDSALEDKISRKPATLFLWDEIGYLLANIRSGKSPHHAQIVSLLMKLYSSAGNIYLGKEYAEKDKQRVIVQPCCCIYGMSTPERLSDGISPMDMQDGWLSRCLMFLSDLYPIKNRKIREKPVPNGISEQCREWFLRGQGATDGSSVSQFVTSHYTQAPPEQTTIESSREAERVFIVFDNESTERGKKYPDMAILWAKSEENARKIALIIAASENSVNPVISESIADYSCRLVRYLLKDFRVILAPEIVSGITEQQKRKIVACIRQYGISGCTKATLTRRTQWANKRQRNDLIEDLIEAGEIIRGLDGRDKRTLNYWTVENFLKFKEGEAK